MSYQIFFFIQAEDGTKTFLKISLEEYYNGTNSKDAVTLAWDSLQINLKCCGVSIKCYEYNIFEE